MLEVVVADQDRVIIDSVQALTVWHHHISRSGFTPVDISRLKEATSAMLAKLRPFEGVGVSQKLPKLHRLRDYGKVIDAYGGARFVTTDMYEMAHKTLKVVLSRYVNDQNLVMFGLGVLSVISRERICVVTRRLCRSNYHDIYADLIRDISRREKVRRFLQLDARPHASPLQAAAPIQTPFGTQLGVSFKLHDQVHILLLPRTIPVPFQLARQVLADRLGLFLTDGARRLTGTYPKPDGDAITVFEFANLHRHDGKPFRLTVKESFYGKPRYPFVEIESPGTPWYARVWLMFACTFNTVTYHLALVSYLSPAPAGRGNTAFHGYSWSSSHLECVELRLIRREVTMVSSFTNSRGMAERERLYHRLDRS